MTYAYNICRFLGGSMKPHHPIHIRQVQLFKNGRNQAVRIPRDFELSGQKALIRKEGNRLIIEPIAALTFAELFSQWKPMKEGIPEISDYPPDPVNL